MTKDDVLKMIPRYKTGEKKGEPRNRRFRDMEKILTWYKVDEHDLHLFRREIERYQEGGDAEEEESWADQEIR